MGNTTRYLQLLHPSADELNYTRRGRVKGVHVNTPTFTWAYTRTFKEKGKKGSVTRSTSSVVSPVKWDVVYLNEKEKMGYEIGKRFTATKSQKKF